MIPAPSFPRRRESSNSNTPRSGQNESFTASLRALALRPNTLPAHFGKRPYQDAAVHRAIRSPDWIPACAGMTKVLK